MYQIDGDSTPPVISAVLTVAVGSLQELTLTVPRSYYDSLATEPEYIYAGGYGGKVESVSLSDVQAVITAKSHAGTGVTDYLRINPSAAEYASETVSGWLDLMAQSASGSTSFSGDGEILGSRPLTAGLAVGEFFSTICQLAGCFGLDVVHTATDAGDIYKFIHADVTADGAVNSVLSLSVQGSKPAYDYAGIFKTAPIDQRDTCTISAERNNNPYGINYTSQGHPYLEGTWNPVDIRVYWRQWTLGAGMRLAPGDFAQYDQQIQLTDEDHDDDWQFKDSIAFAPFFGKRERTMRSRSHEFKFFTSGMYEETSPIAPSEGAYREIYARSEGAHYYYYGVWPTNVDYKEVFWYAHEVHYVRYSDSEYTPPMFDPENPTIPSETDTDEGITSDTHFDSMLYEGFDDEYFQEVPYFFEQECYEANEISHSAGHENAGGASYVTVADWGESRQWFEDKYKAGSDISERAYPWMLLAREIVNSSVVVDTVGDDTTSTRTETQEIVVSKALFDANFNDTYHPATIDPDPPSDIHLDKHSETWFDPSASPAENCRFMGFGLAANIKYQLGWNSQYIMMRINGGAGAATARWDNGAKTRRYNLRGWYNAEIPDGSAGVVKHTLISSNDRSFSTLTEDETGDGYIVTGSVWCSKAVAEACLPYILRQQSRAVQVNFTVPLQLVDLTSAVELVGVAVSVYSHNVYITAVRCDLSSETAAFTGCVYDGLD